MELASTIALVFGLTSIALALRALRPELKSVVQKIRHSP